MIEKVLESLENEMINCVSFDVREKAIKCYVDLVNLQNQQRSLDLEELRLNIEKDKIEKEYEMYKTNYGSIGSTSDTYSVE